MNFQIRNSASFASALCAVFALVLSVFLPNDGLFAQKTDARDKVGVLNFDSKGLTIDPQQMGNLARIELDKTGLYEVLDRYDVEYLVEKESLNIATCYGKICLVEVGRKLKADKMLTGAVELLGENIVVSLRLIDVATETVEKSQVTEFLNLKNQVQPMLSVAMKQMLGQPVDQNLLAKLTKPDDYESAINVPESNRLNLSGPRMGATFFTGKAADAYRRPSSQGGLDATPLMFQFGYQFETTYLNQGGIQALFEFIPLITGLDQGHFIPSISFLHGLRSNRNGFEFAFGPILYLTKEAEGVDVDGQWTLLKDWRVNHPNLPDPENVETRFDTRGNFKAATSFVFAFGKSFKSGKLNMPVNAFVVPHRDGARFGISVGFNGRG